jgi:large conductance mechanosensitive channel
VDFSEMFAVLKAGTVPPPYPTRAVAKTVGAVTLNYGQFVNTIVSFLIVAFAVFLLVKFVNRLRRQQEAPPPATPEEVILLREIRDAVRR